MTLDGLSNGLDRTAARLAIRIVRRTARHTHSRYEFTPHHTPKPQALYSPAGYPDEKSE